MGEDSYITQKPKKYETDMDDFQRIMGNKWEKRAKRLVERRWNAINKRTQGERYATR